MYNIHMGRQVMSTCCPVQSRQLLHHPHGMQALPTPRTRRRASTVSSVCRSLVPDKEAPQQIDEQLLSYERGVPFATGPAFYRPESGLSRCVAPPGGPLPLHQVDMCAGMLLAKCKHINTPHFFLIQGPVDAGSCRAQAETRELEGVGPHGAVASHPWVRL